jgi:hypothetical protein
MTMTALAEPPDAQVAKDAFDFHQFRTKVLAEADGVPGIDAACRRLARRTTPDYLYGVVQDLIKDTSGAEEPYLIAIILLDDYPPDQARAVVRKIIADPKYKACEDVKNWLWEIDEAQKGRAQHK